jgi:hypothetical protein
MSLKLNSSGGGSVTLQEPVTASDLTVNLPATLGNTGNSMVVTSDASGNVGVGTTTPGVRLDVVGTGPQQIRLTNSGSGSADSANLVAVSNDISASLSAYKFGGVGQAGTSSNHPFVLRTNNTERVRIDTSGNVGIGTTSPATKLQVKVGTNQNFTVTSTSGVTQLQSINDAGNAFTQLDVAGSFITLSPGSTERARIDSSGNLLVGTTSTAGPGGARVVAGLFMTLAGSGGLNQAQSATLFTIPTDTAFLVTAQTGNANGLSTVVLVTLTSGGNSAVRTILMQDSGGFFISMSGANVQITNTLGGPIAYSFTAMRIF